MAKRKKKPRTEDLPVSEVPESVPEHVQENVAHPIPPDFATETAFFEDQSSENGESVPQSEGPVDTPSESSSEQGTSPAEPAGLTVAAVVQFREGADQTWKETTQIKTISRNGAGLVLKRQVPVGRIVSLVMEMPQELRIYDHDLPGYLILGVVQNCVSMEVGGEPFYHVGVAFIGKDIPEAYTADPRQCYRITGLNRQGLWEVVESVNPFQPRKHLRFWSRFEITVSIRDSKTRTSRKRNVFTRDVSGGGMSVFGPLDARVGDRVKVMSRQHDFYSMATVRNRTDNEDNENLSLIHFEFDEADFPVDRLATPADGREGGVMSDAWPGEAANGEVKRF